MTYFTKFNPFLSPRPSFPSFISFLCFRLYAYNVWFACFGYFFPSFLPVFFCFFVFALQVYGVWFAWFGYYPKTLLLTLLHIIGTPPINFFLILFGWLPLLLFLIKVKLFLAYKRQNSRIINIISFTMFKFETCSKKTNKKSNFTIFKLETLFKENR